MFDIVLIALAFVAVTVLGFICTIFVVAIAKMKRPNSYKALMISTGALIFFTCLVAISVLPLTISILAIITGPVVARIFVVYLVNKKRRDRDSYPAQKDL